MVIRGDELPDTEGGEHDHDPLLGADVYRVHSSSRVVFVSREIQEACAVRDALNNLAAGLRAPPSGPWKVVASRLLGGGSLWWVENGEREPYSGAYAFKREAEAIAVRDALNQVAAVPSPEGGEA